ncbi:MAG: hypothetical protein ABR548_15630 [Actinomycetota bacterium]|nr:hypothetical protein [Actinomycetota bacterium]
MLRRLLTALAAAAILAVPTFSRAATPATATISPSHPLVSWTGGPIPVPSSTRRSATADPSDVMLPGDPVKVTTSQDGLNQDTFALTVDVPSSYYENNPTAAVRVRVTFPEDASNDLDLELAPANGQWVRVSTLRGSDHDELTLFNLKSGTYNVVTRAFLPFSDTYKATAELVNLSSPLSAALRASTIDFQTSAIVDNPSIDSGEPNVAVDSKGWIYVTAPGSGVAVYRSKNGGVSFTKMGDFDADFQLGGGDADIQIDKHDNLYIADLAVVSINVLKSTDSGEHFDQRAITGYDSDRQWLATYGENTVYLGYHDITLEQELVYRSDDGGVTFTQITPVQVDAASATKDPAAYAQSQADCFENTFSGPVAVDQRDETIYIVYGCSNVRSNLTGRTPPYGPANQIFVGISHDRGVTFTNHEVMRFNPGANVSNLFPTMTVDKAGNPYVVVAKADVEGGPSDVLMTASKDHGETWGAPIQVSSGSGTRMFPWIAAGDPGKVDIVYATTPAVSSDDLNGVWNIEMAQSLNALSENPTFTESRVSDHPIHTGQVCASGILCSVGGDRSLLDFIEVGLDPSGYANVAWTENAGGARHLGFSRQTSGPSVYSSVLGTKITKPAPKPKPQPSDLPSTGVEDARAIAVMALAMGVLLARRLAGSAR